MLAEPKLLREPIKAEAAARLLQFNPSRTDARGCQLKAAVTLALAERNMKGSLYPEGGKIWAFKPGEASASPAITLTCAAGNPPHPSEILVKTADGKIHPSRRLRRVHLKIG